MVMVMSQKRRALQEAGGEGSSPVSTYPCQISLKRAGGAAHGHASTQCLHPKGTTLLVGTLAGVSCVLPML